MNLTQAKQFGSLKITCQQKNHLIPLKPHQTFRTYINQRLLRPSALKRRTGYVDGRSYGQHVLVKAIADDYDPGTTIGEHYQVQSVMGRGGNGTTYRCKDTKTNTDVAVKALSLRSLKDWKQLELFEREAQILENLTHPAIPKYIDYFEVDSENDKAFFLVQELADGKSLEQLITSGWRPEETEIIRIAEELLSILQYLQSLRPPVVHRDIKPANIVLEGGKAGGKVFLVDFGGVQAAKADTLGSTVVGTYGFMAPEQFRGSALPASDVYALGGTLLYLLSGGKPPSAFPVDRLSLDFSNVAMGVKLRAVCEGMLEPVVEDRFSVVQALSILKGQRQPSSRTSSQQQQRGGNAIGGSTFQQRQQQQQQQQQQRTRLPPGFMNDEDFFGDPYYNRNISPSVMQQQQQQQQLQQNRTSTGQKPLSKPAGSRVKVTKNGPTLIIDIPPAKFSGDSLFTGGFAIAWNAFVAFWTMGALAGGGVLFALFSLPFWFAGANLLKQAFGAQLMREHLEINLKTWKLQKQLALFKGGNVSWDGTGGTDSSSLALSGQGQSQGIKTLTGKSGDLAGAAYQVNAYVNGVPQGNIVLKQGVESFVLGEGLAPLEQEWLVDVINRHLDENGEVMQEIAAFAGNGDDEYNDGNISREQKEGGKKQLYDDFAQQELDTFDAKLKKDVQGKVDQAKKDATEAAAKAQAAGEAAAEQARQQVKNSFVRVEESFDSDSTIDVDDFEVKSVNED